MVHRAINCMAMAPEPETHERFSKLMAISQKVKAKKFILPARHGGRSLPWELLVATGHLGLIPGLGKSLEKGKATHSSILA